MHQQVRASLFVSPVFCISPAIAPVCTQQMTDIHVDLSAESMPLMRMHTTARTHNATHTGCAAGAEAVQVQGADISVAGWERLHDTIQGIVA